MEGTVAGLFSMIRNSLYPRILGGVPRKYVFQQTNPIPETMTYLTALVEEGKLKVIVDQVFEMEDALQVRGST
jgi:hypothetical protein